MPSLNGLELLKRIETSNPNVRTILISAYNFELDELYETYLKEGIIDSSIEKPVTINALCQSKGWISSLSIKITFKMKYHL